MEWIQNIPVLFRMLSSLVLILVINQVTGLLPLAILGGTLFMAFWTGNSFPVLVETGLDAMKNLDNLYLSLVIICIIALSTLMAHSGVMNDMVTWVTSRMHTRLSMAVLPAIIGFLPMPGGALFSAPLVDDCDSEGSVSAHRKTAVNYWFRHIWEFWWPIYPGVLLAMDISGLSVSVFIMLMGPLSLFCALGGYLFLLRKIRGSSGGQNEESSSLFISLLPVLTVLISYALIKIFFPAAAEHSKYLPMLAGLFLSLLVLQFQKKIALKKWLSVFMSPKTLIMVLLILAIRLYGAYVDAAGPDGIKLMSLMKDELQAFGIPVWFTLVSLPFIAGITMGISVGLVGASYPIVMQLLHQMDPVYLYPGIILAVTAGYLGMMLSPVHVCLIVTNQHFKTGLVKSLGYLVGPVFTVGAGGLVLALFWRLAGA